MGMRFFFLHWGFTEKIGRMPDCFVFHPLGTRMLKEPVKLIYCKVKTRLNQFGLLPPRTLLSAFGAKPVLANSIPKAGTNLLIQTLTMIDYYHRKIHKTFYESNENELKSIVTKNNRNKILVGHLPYNEKLGEDLKNNSVIKILIVRDPRDIALSNVHYIQSIDKSHRLHKYFSKNLKSFNERLSASICGIPAIELNGEPASMDVGWHIRRYLGWCIDPECLVIRFEDLIGKNGGGTDERQHETLRKILEHLSINKSEGEIETIAKKIFNPGSRTFNRGVIGQWKLVYKNQHIRQFECVAGDCIDALGYR